LIEFARLPSLNLSSSSKSTRAVRKARSLEPEMAIDLAEMAIERVKRVNRSGVLDRIRNASGRLTRIKPLTSDRSTRLETISNISCSRSLASIQTDPEYLARSLAALRQQASSGSLRQSNSDGTMRNVFYCRLS
jgi:hypothetical protein